MRAIENPSPEILKRRRDQKRRKYAIATGRSCRIRRDEFEQAKRYMASLEAMGMSDAMIARQCTAYNGRKFHRTTVQKIRRGEQTGLTRPTFEAIMAVVPERPTSRGALIDKTGTVRRLQALCAHGFNGLFLAELLGMSQRNLTTIIRGATATVYGSTAYRVSDLYAKLAEEDPADHGIDPVSIGRSRSQARKKGWAPPDVWDPDTIDDPQARPEWTGACGTALGVYVHERDGIPLCAACSDDPAPWRIPEGMFSPALFKAAYRAGGYSAESLAAAIGVSPDSVYKWQVPGNARQPRPMTLQRIADELGIVPEELFV